MYRGRTASKGRRKNNLPVSVYVYVLGYWNVGVLECWSTVGTDSDIPPIQYSKTRRLLIKNKIGKLFFAQS